MISATGAKSILPTLSTTIDQLLREFDQIPNDRKSILNELTDFIKERAQSGAKIYLNFICTHNSRRSHMAQLWAQAAGYYFGINDVQSFSGGTEATAFNARAVSALKEAGFYISVSKEGENPVYQVKFSNDTPAIISFSKTYDDAFNPKKDFAAIMTCSQADENCPIVFGASKRITLPYDDPKDFDGTPQEAEKYKERAHQIGREIFYAFSQVK